MSGMQFNKPRFDWEAKDRLSELEQFKQECNVLFQGPLSRYERSTEGWINCELDRKTMHYDVALDECRTR